jgi:hypothetical protein
MYSLRHPPSGLTLIHQLLWPLIFAQLVALKNWVRVNHGRGVPYGYFVSRWGRVTLTHVGAQPFTSYSAAGTFAPVAFDFAQFVSKGLKLALAAGRGAPAPAIGAPQRAGPAYACTPHTDTS